MSEVERKSKAWRITKALASEQSQIGAVSCILLELIAGTRQQSSRINTLEKEVADLKEKCG